MIRHNILGGLICSAIFVGCFFYGEGGRVLYFNVISFLVVASGTIGAAFFSFPYERLKNAFKVAVNTYRKDALDSPDQIVHILLDLSVRSRADGILTLEKLEHTHQILFLKNALGLLVDGYREDEIREILHNEMYYFKNRRQLSERVFRTAAQMAPGFGVAGSIIGLIGMLYGVSEPGVILKTIPVALTSTLYGTVLSYYILVPLAESIHARTQKELFMQSIMTDGIIEIGKEQNLFKLEKRLSSFLTPASRGDKEQSLRDLRKRYTAMKGSRHSAPDLEALSAQAS